jgi:hypothetical protein
MVCSAPAFVNGHFHDLDELSYGIVGGRRRTLSRRHLVARLLQVFFNSVYSNGRVGV